MAIFVSVWKIKGKDLLALTAKLAGSFKRYSVCKYTYPLPIDTDPYPWSSRDFIFLAKKEDSVYIMFFCELSHFQKMLVSSGNESCGLKTARILKIFPLEVAIWRFL